MKVFTVGAPSRERCGAPVGVLLLTGMLVEHRSFLMLKKGRGLGLTGVFASSHTGVYDSGLTLYSLTR